MSDIKITAEQHHIIQTVKNGVDCLSIHAFAGTGKTTTLNLLANEIQDKTFFYLAFNKSIQQEASKKFPPNVEVKTTHGLAYYYILARNRLFNNLKSSEYHVKELEDILKISQDDAIQVYELFNTFCNSAYLSIDDVPNFTDEIKKLTTELWKKINKLELEIPHSFYLKKFQLSLVKNKIQVKPVDIVMLDEAQDTNDVTLSIFLTYPAKQRILVGDPHQQIYSFRGSVNIMDQVHCDKLYLSQSFRFTPDIAEFVSSFLKFFKKETVDIKGNPDLTPLKNPTKAILTRNNSTLIQMILELIEYASKKNRNTINSNDVLSKYLSENWTVVRDPDSIFAYILNLIAALNRKNTLKEYNFVKQIVEECNYDIDKIQEYAYDVGDYELAACCSMLQSYTEEAIKNAYSASKKHYSNKTADLYLSTVHTAKGLEWDKVLIANDFNLYEHMGRGLADAALENVELEYLITEKKLKSKSYFEEFLNNFDKIPPAYIDEINLFYVALTRAKFELLDLNEIFIDVYVLEKSKNEEEIEVILDRISEGIQSGFERQLKTSKVNLNKNDKSAFWNDEDIF